MKPFSPRSDFDEPVRTGEQAIAFLEGLVRPDPRPYAARAPLAQRCVRALLERVGNPHAGLRVVHITGSKGKGTTALFTEAILEAAGLRTGTFTSPHLERWTERYRIGGREISASDLAHAIETLRPHVAALCIDDPDNAPTFFDVATAAALLLFREAVVDCAIVEVGIGGRLDATNVVDPAVSCITAVELEHTDKLGTDLGSIAREKAGIIKPGRPTVIGSLPDAALRQVERRAAQVQVPLLQLGRELQVEVGPARELRTPIVVSLAGQHVEALLPVPAPHLAAGAALAFGCAERLGILDPDTLADATRRGLATTTLPGRCEILRHRPWVVVDGAHTVASARALRTMLDSIPAAERRFVLSVSGQRDPAALARELFAGNECVIATRADAERSLDAAELAAALQRTHPQLRLTVESNPAAALALALSALQPETLLCITGSVYMAGLGRHGKGGHRVRQEYPTTTSPTD